MDFKQPKTTFEKILKMINETMANLNDPSLNVDIDSDEWLLGSSGYPGSDQDLSLIFNFDEALGDLYLDPFFGLDMPDEPWYGPQKEQLSWDIRDFEPYEAGRLNSPNREEG